MIMPVSWDDLDSETKQRFSMHGLINPWYSSIVADTKSIVPIHYSARQFKMALGLTKLFECGHYGAIDTWLYLALQKYNIKDKEICILGSADQGYGPWYECMALNHGARVTVVDYNKITYEYPDIKFYEISEIKNLLKTGYKFDCLLSVSSIEHDGLGRYGDPINPDADLETMNTLRSYLKPNGLFFITVPIGLDRLCYNTHRVYGPHRLPKLLEHWFILDSFGYADGYAEKLLNRDVAGNWNPKGKDGSPMFKWYPAYEPLFVLQNNK